MDRDPREKYEIWRRDPVTVELFGDVSDQIISDLKRAPLGTAEEKDQALQLVSELKAVGRLEQRLINAKGRATT